MLPQGDAMMCMVDDRADVWEGATNLVQVTPYYYFKSVLLNPA